MQQIQTERENYIWLKKEAQAAGATLFGVCKTTDIKNILDISKEVVASLGYVISLAVRVADKIIEDIKTYPTKLYFYHYRQLNYFLDRIALYLTCLIQQSGFQALPIPASQTIDWENQKGHISHREVAQLAGLGWRGRNNLIVHPEFGARIRLVSILTDLPLSIDEPIKGDCGSCKACIEVCPANAIKEKKEDFDLRACFEQLDIFRKKYNIGHHICGICVKACKGFK